MGADLWGLVGKGIKVSGGALICERIEIQQQFAGAYEVEIRFRGFFNRETYEQFIAAF